MWTDLLSVVMYTILYSLIAYCTGGAESSLHYLNQKVPHAVLPKTSSHLTGGWSGSVAVQQQAILLLTYTAYYSGDMLRSKFTYGCYFYTFITPFIIILHL